jgi:hypothetical protein
MSVTFGVAGVILTVSVKAGTAGRQGEARLHDTQRMEAPRRSDEVDTARQTARRHWQGAPLSHWARQQARWVTSIPLGANPMTDTTGVHCAVHQEGSVWYLAAPVKLSTPFNKTCTVPLGTALFVPLAAYLNDYPCRLDPGFQPAPGQSLDAFLAEGAAFVVSNFTSYEATLNGRMLTPLRAATSSFAFVGADDVTPIDACITGASQSGLVDGYFLAIDPLPVGDHDLFIRSVNNLFGNTEGSFHIQVR